MENDLAELRKLLSTAVQYLDAIYGQVTDQMIMTQALLTAATERDPEFEAAYHQALRDQQCVSIRQTRSLGYPSLAEAVRLLKQ
jgi:hypothetical protein